jgi:hypothetical protein
MIILKGFFLMFTGFRKLKVDSVFVNNAFLLSNGLVIIHWQVKNALWICIQDKWIGSQQNQMMVYADGTTILSIRFQGLFSSYKKRFVLRPLATLIIPELPSPNTFVPPVADKIYPGFLQNLRLPNPTLKSQVFITNIPFVEVIIPPFQTENHYDKRLLHHP